MSTETTNSQSSTEAPDLQEILDKLTSLESRAGQAQTAKSDGGIWGWVVALVVGAVVAIGAGLLIWQLNKKNAELARLRTKVELDELKAQQLEHSATTAKHHDVIDRLVTTATTIREGIAEKQAKIQQEEVLLADARARVEAARNWDDLDRLNSEGR